MFEKCLAGIDNTIPAVILVDLLGVEKLTRTLSALTVSIGLATVIATPLSGNVLICLFDTIQNEFPNTGVLKEPAPRQINQS